MGLNSKKTVQSKISLKEDDVIQFEPKMMQIRLKPFILIWQETYSKNHQSFLSNLIQKKLRRSTKPNIKKIEPVCTTTDITNTLILYLDISKATSMNNSSPKF